MGDKSGGKSVFVLMLMIVALAAVLRLHGLARWSIWYDESIRLIGPRYVDWAFTWLDTKETRVEPLYAVLLFFWERVIGFIPGLEAEPARYDWFLRLPSVVFSVLYVPGVYLCALRLLKHTHAAAASAFLVAISPFHIYYAQELGPHCLYALLCLASFYFTERWLSENRTQDWIALILCIVLAIYAYYLSAWYVIAINIYCFLRLARQRRRLFQWFIGQAAAFILIIPAVLMAIMVFGFHVRAEEHWFPHPNLVTAAVTIKNFFAGFTPRTMIYWPLFIGAVALILLGLYRIRNDRQSALILIALSSLPILLQIVFWSTQEFAFYTYRVQIAFSFPFFILAGAGIAFSGAWPRKVIPVAIMALLTIPALADSYNQRLHPSWAHRIGVRYKVDYRSAAHYVAQRFEENDFVAHGSTFTLGPFKYRYLDVDQAFVGFLNEDDQALLHSYPDEKMWDTIGFSPIRIEDAIKGVKRVWYISSWWEPLDLDPAVKRFRDWLDAKAVRIDHARFDGIQVFLYDMNPELQARTRPNRIADSGPEVVPHFAFAEEGSADSDLSLLEANFSKQFPLELSTLNSAFTVEFETRILGSIQGDEIPAGFSELARLPRTQERLLGGIARTADGGITASLRLYNPTPIDHVIRGLVYKSAHVIPAFAFDRGSELDVWRPTDTYYKRPAMVAIFTGQEPEHTIRATIYPETGPHALFLRYFREGAESNQNRAHVTVDVIDADGQRSALGDVPGNDSGRATGWFWARLADFSSTGQPVVVELTARNNDNLNPAYFDFERVVVCLAKDVDGGEPPILSRFRIDLPALSEKFVPIEIDGLPGFPARLDFELFDDESMEMRNIYFNFSR